MIIEPIVITENGVTFNSLTYHLPYYAVGYESDSLIIKLMTDEENPQLANSKTQSLLEGFGSDNWIEFNEEIVNRGLIFPE